MVFLHVTSLSPLWRYWWLKLKSLAEKEEWEELEKFSKTKKSPIGYLVRTKRFMLSDLLLCPGNVSSRENDLLLLSLIQPFVEVCMKSNNKCEAKKYVSRVTPEQKVRAHLAIR